MTITNVESICLWGKMYFAENSVAEDNKRSALPGQSASEKLGGLDLEQLKLYTGADGIKRPRKMVTSVFQNGSTITTRAVFTKKIVEYANKKEKEIRRDGRSCR